MLGILLLRVLYICGDPTFEKRPRGEGGVTREVLAEKKCRVPVMLAAADLLVAGHTWRVMGTWEVG